MQQCAWILYWGNDQNSNEAGNIWYVESEVFLDKDLAQARADQLEKDHDKDDAPHFYTDIIESVLVIK